MTLKYFNFILLYASRALANTPLHIYHFHLARSHSVQYTNLITYHRPCAPACTFDHFKSICIIFEI